MDVKVLLIIFVINLSRSEVTCISSEAFDLNCTYKFSNGSIVNFRNITTSTEINGVDISFQPCKNNTSLSQSLSLSTRNNGKLNTSSVPGFISEEDGLLKLIYNYSPSWHVDIILQCSNEKYPLLVVNDATDLNNNVLVLTLSTSDVCLENNKKEGTSFITILLFIIVGFALIYFIGGALLLKLAFGAEGVEMIPNYKFWTQVPNKIKAGSLYCWNGCPSQSGYDQI